MNACPLVLALGSVLQIKELPSRPSEYDGLLILGGVLTGVSEVEIKGKLQQFGQIESCHSPAGTIIQHRVKFVRHQDAERAAAAAKDATSWTDTVCKWASIAFDDIRAYDDRGW